MFKGGVFRMPKKSYASTKDAICDAIETVFNRFDHDFINVKGKGEHEVREYINDTLRDRGINAIIDDYVYILEVNGDTIIKR